MKSSELEGNSQLRVSFSREVVMTDIYVLVSGRVIMNIEERITTRPHQKFLYSS